MRPHTKLDVWKKAVEFTVDIYKITNAFPNDERFGLTSQIRRASVSIAANIAEGAGRKSDREFLRSLSMAQGSASEVDTEVLIAHRLGYMDEEVCNEVAARLDDIGRMITGLSHYLKERTDKNS